MNKQPDLFVRTVRARRTIAGSDNPAVVGGMTTRNNGRYNGNGREWATPVELFTPLHEEFGFTVDVCASTQNANFRGFGRKHRTG